ARRRARTGRPGDRRQGAQPRPALARHPPRRRKPRRRLSVAQYGVDQGLRQLTVSNHAGAAKGRKALLLRHRAEYPGAAPQFFATFAFFASKGHENTKTPKVLPQKLPAVFVRSCVVLWCFRGLFAVGNRLYFRTECNWRRTCLPLR